MREADFWPTWIRLQSPLASNSDAFEKIPSIGARSASGLIESALTPNP